MTHRQPVITEAMRQMDHAEDVVSQGLTLAKTCFEEQGLPEHAKVIAQVSKHRVPEKVKPGPPPSNWSAAKVENILLRLLVGLGFLAGGSLLMVIMGTLVSESATTSTATSPPPYVAEVGNVRLMAAQLSTQDVNLLAQGKQPTDEPVDENEQINITPVDYQAIRKLGELTVIDREGRPELHWSQVSPAVCHALIQDIYQSPSVHGVVVTVDGQNTGVSCAGSPHDIVLTPHL